MQSLEILLYAAPEGKTHIQNQEATRFRIWATKTLREFIIKGFVLDDARNYQSDFDEQVKHLKKDT